MTLKASKDKTTELPLAYVCALVYTHVLRVLAVLFIVFEMGAVSFCGIIVLN